MLIAVVLTAAVAAVIGLVVVNYQPVRGPARAALAAHDVHHFTSAETGALIDNGDGTVTLAATRSRGWLVAQLAHMVWSRTPATYVYTGLPTRWEKRLHHDRAPEVVVRIDGADLLAHHPGLIYRSLRSNALALPDGYAGPGTVAPVTRWTDIRR